MKKKIALLALVGGAAYWWMNMKIKYPEIQTTSSHSYDLEILARTLWGEARGEGKDGMEAVAATIMERVASPKWPDSVAAVCLQPWQFSAWNKNDPNRAKLLTINEANLHYRTALSVAKDAMEGKLSTSVSGANHYFADWINPPSWARSMDFVGKVGKHNFYRG